MIIRTGTREDAVKQHRQIIEHVSKRSEKGEHGSSANMKDCMIEYGKIARKAGLSKEPVIFDKKK